MVQSRACALPTDTLNASDGSIIPLSPQEENISTLVMTRKATCAKGDFFQKEGGTQAPQEDQGCRQVAQVQGRKKVKYPEQRTASGRLLSWDHLQDELSYLLCQPEEGDGSQEPMVQRAASTSRDS